jgi:hypothetical protein
MKPGVKLKSQACETEVMVVRCGAGSIDCGGVAMANVRPETPGTLAADHAKGTLIGKRYVDDGGSVELLCIKAGKGSLSVDGKPLAIKDAKPLPASD